jgi:hypothetical protein
MQICVTKHGSLGIACISYMDITAAVGFDKTNPPEGATDQCHCAALDVTWSVYILALCPEISNLHLRTEETHKVQNKNNKNEMYK